MRDIDKYADEALAINRMVEHNLSSSMHLSRSSSTFFYAEIQQQQEKHELKLNEIKYANEHAASMLQESSNDQADTPTGSPRMFSIGGGGGEDDDDFDFDEFQDKFSFCNDFINTSVNSINQTLDHVDTMAYLFSNKLCSYDRDERSTTKSIQIRPRFDEDNSSVDYFLASSVDTVIMAPHMRTVSQPRPIPTMITPSSTSSSSANSIQATSIENNQNATPKKARKKNKKKKKSALGQLALPAATPPPLPTPSPAPPASGMKQLFSSIVTAVANSVTSSVQLNDKTKKKSVLNNSNSDSNLNSKGGKKHKPKMRKPHANQMPSQSGPGAASVKAGSINLDQSAGANMSKHKAIKPNSRKW